MEYSSTYSMRWEIERMFSMLGGIMGSENIIGLKVVAYNLIVVSNIEFGDSRREIMKIVSC